MMRLYVFSMFVLGIMVFLFLSVQPSFAPPEGGGGESCPVNMVPVGDICIDQHEATVWSESPRSDGTPMGTQFGVTGDDYPCSDNGNDCSATASNPIFAASAPGETPSASITWFQAHQACLNVGKRLPTNAEWQGAAAGTPDTGGADDGSTTCNTDDLEPGISLTGSRSNCVSNFGAFDMVGNLLEWVADWIQGSTHPWKPSLGTAGPDYGDDFMLGTNPARVQGVNSSNFPAVLFRGGRFDAGTGAGVFTLNANFAPSGSFNGVGFRCARNR
ncbi:MAG: SUMF1/EgtB/PvdO family nonheme iron enzyme [Candidatus Dadabacteria bacterium]|nr:SUMF1/EgtB/PvdO family nonheme iron enzyme [Candidatus Dadabacteria bacterium]